MAAVPQPPPPSPTYERSHNMAQAVLDAALIVVSSQPTCSMQRKIDDIIQRTWAATRTSVEARRFTTATNTDYPILPKDHPNYHNDGSDYMVFAFPDETGYLEYKSLVGPLDNIFPSIKQGYDGYYTIQQMRTVDGSGTVAYRLVFVEDGVSKKVEPIVVSEAGLSIEVEDRRPMLFPSWKRLLGQIGKQAQHLLYVCIPKEFLSPIPRTYSPSTIPKPMRSTAAANMHILNVCCERDVVPPPLPPAPGQTLPKPMGYEVMRAVFSTMSRYTSVTKVPCHTHLNSPTLSTTLQHMDTIYNTVASGDSVVFYFSGHGRQLFSPSPSSSEPMVGLTLADSIISPTEAPINQVTDLTNTWIRYWCNALYMIKKVHNVVLILDTSFVDPASFTPTPERAKRVVRSLPAHIMSPSCNVDLPSNETKPAWYDIGKCLDRPKEDLIQSKETPSDAPYYFAPSRLWANRHVVIQAACDTQMADANIFYDVVPRRGYDMLSVQPRTDFPPGIILGNLTHVLYRAIDMYFPWGRDQKIAVSAIPLDTYSSLVNRLNSAGKGILSAEQKISCFIGESIKTEPIFTCKAVEGELALVPRNNIVKVEAISQDEETIFTNMGVLGLPSGTMLSTHPPTHSNVIQPFAALNIEMPGDLFVGKVKVMAQITIDGETSPAIKAGDSLRVTPDPSYLSIGVAVPYGTHEKDSELVQKATLLLNALRHKGFTHRDAKLIEHPKVPTAENEDEPSPHRLVLTLCRNDTPRLNTSRDERNHHNLMRLIMDSPVDEIMIASAKVLLASALDLFDTRNYQKAFDTILLVIEQLTRNKKEVEYKALLEKATAYLRYAHLQSQFFLATSALPQEVDVLALGRGIRDPVTNCVTYLCPPTHEMKDLINAADTWYWRTWKINRIARMNERTLPELNLGRRNILPTPLGVPQEVGTHTPHFVIMEGEDGGKRRGPVEMQFGITSKVTTAVPNKPVYLLHPTERIEMTMCYRHQVTQREMVILKERYAAARKKEITDPVVVARKRFRFHVLQFRVDGSIHLLTENVTMVGHAINLAIDVKKAGQEGDGDEPFPQSVFTYIARNPTTSTMHRIGSCTIDDDLLPLYFSQSTYKLTAPLEHAAIVLVDELDDGYPPLFDMRFFEQGQNIRDMDPRARRGFICNTPAKLQQQIDSRRIKEKNVDDGDHVQVEWFHVRHLPPHDAIPVPHLHEPSHELKRQLQQYTVTAAVPPPPGPPCILTRVSPLDGDKDLLALQQRKANPLVGGGA